jgi:hypothetical protein
MMIRKTITSQLLDAYGVTALLRKGRAVVLERIARSGGAVSWFLCNDEKTLPDINDRFKPGSVVSFYFDDRMKICRANDLPIDDIGTIIDDTGECVVGRIADNGIDIDAVEFFSSTEIRTEFSDQHADAMLIYGPFPAREYSPSVAITFILPDDDGVFRAHPH